MVVSALFCQKEASETHPAPFLLDSRLGLELGLDQLVIGIWEGVAGMDGQVGIRIGFTGIGIGIGKGWDGWVGGPSQGVRGGG